MADSIPIIKEPRKFPPGCGPTAPKTGAAFRWYYQLRLQHQEETSNLAPAGHFSAQPPASRNPPMEKAHISSTINRLRWSWESSVIRKSEAGLCSDAEFKNRNLGIAPKRLRSPRSGSGSSPRERNVAPSSIHRGSWRRLKVARKSELGLAGNVGGGVGVGKSRERVLETLKLFRRRCQELSSSDENDRRVDMKAFKEFKANGQILQFNSNKIGSVPGVEVEEKFKYRAELIIIGLHRRLQHGIDTTMKNGRLVATCVVSTEGYDDKLTSSDVVVYTGEGGGECGGKNKGKMPADQTLTRGNLALKNSSEDKNDVRVVRGLKLPSTKAGKTTYVYDGLYEVTGWEYKKGKQGNMVYEFEMKRKPGQPRINWNKYISVR